MIDLGRSTRSRPHAPFGNGRQTHMRDTGDPLFQSIDVCKGYLWADRVVLCLRSIRKRDTVRQGRFIHSYFFKRYLSAARAESSKGLLQLNLAQTRLGIQVTHTLHRLPLSNKFCILHVLDILAVTWAVALLLMQHTDAHFLHKRQPQFSGYGAKDGKFTPHRTKV